MIYDAHIHNKNKENGGFIIGLEGEPYFKGTINNQEALSYHDPKNKYIAFYYITKDECGNTSIDHPYLKYHPRREKYTPDEVIASIKVNRPKAVIVDTLNEPYWLVYDYWKVAKECSNIIFIFAHSGGYLINDFIKICHFQPNVWIDFALTHTTLGKLGNKEYGLNYINNAIRYALNSAFRKRVLLGSDYPFFDQEDVFEYYKNDIELLNENFLYLLETISQ